MLCHLRKNCMLNFGHKGGNFTLKAHHDDKLWFSSKLRLEADCYWNVYGLNPESSRSNDNAVQINVPIKGINRSKAGLFAEDASTKEIYLLHRGKIGGGRKGIGKTAFVSWYKGKIVIVDELDGRSSELFLVTSIRDPDIANKVRKFVSKVADFKSEITEKLKKQSQRKKIRSNIASH